MRKSCPLHTKHAAQPMHCNFWSQLQLRTRTPLTHHALHIFALYPGRLHSQISLLKVFDRGLVQVPLLRIPCWKDWQEVGEGRHRGTGKLEDTFAHWLSTFLFIDHPQIPLLMSYIIAYSTTLCSTHLPTNFTITSAVSIPALWLWCKEVGTLLWI